MFSTPACNKTMFSCVCYSNFEISLFILRLFFLCMDCSGLHYCCLSAANIHSKYTFFLLIIRKHRHNAKEINGGFAKGIQCR